MKYDRKIGASDMKRDPDTVAALRAQVAGMALAVTLARELMAKDYPDAGADLPGDIYERLRAALAETPR